MQENELQKKYLEFQLLNEKLIHLQEQHSLLQTHLNELSTTLSSLEEISSLKKNKDILIPLSNNIFTKANLNPVNTLLVGVGSNLLIENSAEEASQSIEEQRKELIILLKKIEAEFSRITQAIKLIQPEIAHQ